MVNATKLNGAGTFNGLLEPNPINAKTWAKRCWKDRLCYHPSRPVSGSDRWQRFGSISYIVGLCKAKPNETDALSALFTWHAPHHSARPLNPESRPSREPNALSLPNGLSRKYSYSSEQFCSRLLSAVSARFNGRNCSIANNDFCMALFLETIHYATHE